MNLTFTREHDFRHDHRHRVGEPDPIPDCRRVMLVLNVILGPLQFRLLLPRFGFSFWFRLRQIARLAYPATMLLAFVIALIASPALAQAPAATPPAAAVDVKTQLLSFAIKFVLVPLSLALVGLALAGMERLRKKWTAEADAATAKGESDTVATVLAKFMGFAEVVVQDLENNEKAKLEDAAADGEIAPEEGAVLKATALERLKVLAGTEGLKELQDVLGIAAEGLPALLSGLIEKAVALVSTRSANIAALNAKVPAPTPVAAPVVASSP